MIVFSAWLIFLLAIYGLLRIFIFVANAAGSTIADLSVLPGVSSGS